MDSNLTERIASLEKQIRFLKRCIGVFALVVVVVAACGAAAETWNGYVAVKDTNGTERINIGTHPLAPKASGIMITDENGKMRITLGTDENGDPALQFYDTSGNKKSAYKP